MMSMNLSHIAILNIKTFGYCCIISGISKNEAISLMQIADLTEKIGTLQNIKKLLSCIKMGKEILTFEDIDIEKNKFYRHKNPAPLRDVDIEKLLASKKISFAEKTINALLVTYIIIIKLSHYMYCFLKQVLM